MADDPTPHPELRSSDADRERTAQLLRHAAGEGRLTFEELDERLDRAYAARTGSELTALTADVVPRREAAALEHRPASDVPAVRRAGGDDAHWILSIMSGANRNGHWRLGRRTTCLNIMGGSDLDLNDVELGDDVVELTVFSFWGGADIRVPDGLNVELSELNVMGGNDVQLGAARPNPGGPTLRLKLTSIMGGTNVRRGRKLSKQERRELGDAERSGLPHGGHAGRR